MSREPNSTGSVISNQMLTIAQFLPNAIFMLTDLQRNYETNQLTTTLHQLLNKYSYCAVGVIKGGTMQPQRERDREKIPVTNTRNFQSVSSSTQKNETKKNKTKLNKMSDFLCRLHLLHVKLPHCASRKRQDCLSVWFSFS